MMPQNAFASRIGRPMMPLPGGGSGIAGVAPSPIAGMPQAPVSGAVPVMPGIGRFQPQPMQPNPYQMHPPGMLGRMPVQGPMMQPGQMPTQMATQLPAQAMPQNYLRARMGY